MIGRSRSWGGEGKSHAECGKPNSYIPFRLKLKVMFVKTFLRTTLVYMWCLF